MKIATITLNPAIDTTYTLAHLELGSINRVDAVHRDAGGKGLNVAKVLQHLGEKPLCLGFIGGGVGQQLSTLMQARNLTNSFTPIREESRICLNFITESHHTEVLESGPFIHEQEAELFLENLEALLKKERLSYITLSGSLPKGLPDNFYGKIIGLSRKYSVFSAIDSSGIALKEAIRATPQVLKVNTDEFVGALNLGDKSQLSILDAMRVLEEIPTILITLGKDGALAKHHQDFYRIEHPVSAQVVNATGSGDSVLAGLIYALAHNHPIIDALSLAVACGIDNTQHLTAGRINRENLRSIQETISIKSIT